MTLKDTGKILALCASFDLRTVGKADIVAWHSAVGDLPFADASEAVIAHYRDTRERIMPADIRARVKAIRAQRLETAPHLEAPSGLDGPAYKAWLISARKRIADGTDRPRALEAS